MTIETLQSLAKDIRTHALQDLAAASTDPVVQGAGWKTDSSRQYLTPEINSALLAHASEVDLKGAIDRLFNAEIVNPSENRPALHWALRLPPQSDLTQSEHDTTVKALAKAGSLIQSGTFSAIVHIGIGGSDFGPRLYADAFADHQVEGLELRFCANVVFSEMSCFHKSAKSIFTNPVAVVISDIHFIAPAKISSASLNA